jgi:hypothetical protein
MMGGPGRMGGFGMMCNPAAAGFAEWRIDRLERAIRPTDAQRAKFDEFKAASAKARETMVATCPDRIPDTVIGRMELMERRAEAMAQAVKTVKPALQAFYETLTDDQKARLDRNTGQNRFWRWRDRW